MSNRLCDESVHSLTKILSLNNSKLRILDLQNTGITDEGVKYVAEMLKTNTTLECLLLGANEINDQGVERLSNAMHSLIASSLREQVHKRFECRLFGKNAQTKSNIEDI